eukprot:m.474515 g.474515  ORF g.474515 m.474515 type:complete len:54 (+) comp36357_c0_seq1:149-310(+)
MQPKSTHPEPTTTESFNVEAACFSSRPPRLFSVKTELIYEVETLLRLRQEPVF